MTDSSRVTGLVLRLKCKTCDAVFHHFQFSGEEDSDTMGLCSLSSCKKINEIAVFRLLPEEWNDLDGAGAVWAETRINSNLERTDLRVIKLLKVTQVAPPAGTSFLEFRKAYKPAILEFSCACCESGEALEIFKFTPAEFREAGGIFITADHLTVV